MVKNNIRCFLSLEYSCRFWHETQKMLGNCHIHTKICRNLIGNAIDNESFNNLLANALIIFHLIVYLLPNKFYANRYIKGLDIGQCICLSSHVYFKTSK